MVDANKRGKEMLVIFMVGVETDRMILSIYYEEIVSAAANDIKSSDVRCEGTTKTGVVAKDSKYRGKFALSPFC